MYFISTLRFGLAIFFSVVALLGGQLQTASAGSAITTGLTWDYLHPTDGIDPAIADADFNTTWFTLNEPGTSYDGPAFANSGPGILGYGGINAGPIVTNIGTPPVGSRYTAYFTTTFNLDPAAADVSSLTTNILADDGAFVYINGALAGSTNVTGADTYFLPADGFTSPCTGVNTEDAICSLPLDESLLVDGLNTIAVAVHNQSATSSDFGFDLSLTATGAGITHPPFAPSPDAAWSMVIFPDTQNYSKGPMNLPVFNDMANWVVDNRDSFGIQAVLHEGDIINKYPGTQSGIEGQWANAKSAMSILDGEVPYILSVGNNDLGENANVGMLLNNYFSESDNPLVDPAQGGILRETMDPGRLENAFYEVTAPDGRNLLIFSLAWDPQQAELDWADEVAGRPEFADHTAILLTHSYLGNNGQRNAMGNNMWNELVKTNGNFEMVFAGHAAGSNQLSTSLESTGDEGNVVQQMLFNTQGEANGGNGWLRVVEFLEDGTTVRVRTYSPFLEQLQEDLNSTFTFQISQVPELPGDFDGDGDIDGADFLSWQRDTSVGSLSDWQANFGVSSTLEAANAVPEPTSAAMLLLAAMFAGATRSRKPRG